MDKETKLVQLDLQFTEMLSEIKTSLMQKSQSLLNSGAIDEDSFLMENDYILAKMIISAYMEQKPYQPLSYKKEYNNIKNFI